MTPIACIIAFLSMTIVLYLFGAFVYLSLNPNVWADNARCNLGFMWVAIAFYTIYKMWRS